MLALDDFFACFGCFICLFWMFYFLVLDVLFACSVLLGDCIDRQSHLASLCPH